jgi:hypothetical protein
VAEAGGDVSFRREKLTQEGDSVCVTIQLIDGSCWTIFISCMYLEHLRSEQTRARRELSIKMRPKLSRRSTI